MDSYPLTATAGGFPGVTMRLLTLILVLLLTLVSVAPVAAAPVSDVTNPSKETLERQVAVQTALGKLAPTQVLRGATVLKLVIEYDYLEAMRLAHVCES